MKAPTGSRSLDTYVPFQAGLLFYHGGIRMKKIPSLYKRDYDGNRQVYNEVVPGSEWVFTEGTATEKFDGTACMVRDGVLYKRYDAKKGKVPPADWEPCEDAPDARTGHWPGWVPVTNKPEDKWHVEAFNHADDLPDGTYELVGPKVQGNPYNLVSHELIRHGSTILENVPTEFDDLRAWLESHPCEGIVWHHPDGRMVKIKRRDFGLQWPIRK
jgi:hypothetical protein